MPLIEFVGLKAKMYSLKNKEGDEIVESKRAKGVKKCVLKKRVSREYYKNMFIEKSYYLPRSYFKKVFHSIFTIYNPSGFVVF